VLGIKLAQNRPVQGELADISGRRLGLRIGRGVVGLEIDDQNFVWRHHQAVNLPGNQRLRPARQVEPADNGNFGPAAFGKDSGESGV